MYNILDKMFKSVKYIGTDRHRKKLVDDWKMTQKNTSKDEILLNTATTTTTTTTTDKKKKKKNQWLEGEICQMCVWKEERVIIHE